MLHLELSEPILTTTRMAKAASREVRHVLERRGGQVC